jgi:hypothetical protein
MLPTKRFRSKLFQFGTLFITLQALVVVPPTALASERPIYVAVSQQDYLRLVPLSLHDGYAPLLFSPEGEQTAAIMHFANLYEGNPVFLEGQDIDRLISQRWTRAETVVVSQDELQLGILASVIASAIDAPLYFGSLPDGDLGRLGVQQVVALGNVAVSERYAVKRLENLQSARDYYDSLVGDASFAVLTVNNNFSFLAAEVAAYHRGAVLFSREEIPEQRPRYLAWVTTPTAVTIQAVQSLYRWSRFTPGSGIYDVGIGILTGFNPHDAALLLARAYAYPEFQGEWKTRLVAGNTDRETRSQTTHVGPLEIVTLDGKALTTERFSQLVRTAGNVIVEGHGSPSGIRLSNSSWPDSNEINDLPPLIFAAESCETANFTKIDLSRSIALRLIAGGAVAYVGSMETGGVAFIGQQPFGFSTPRQPIAELVRLQAAARLDTDADWPRSILIGEPTFHQYQHEWVDYQLLPENGKTPRLQIKSLEDEGFESGDFSPLVVLDLPELFPVDHAEGLLDSGSRVRYLRGTLFFDSPLAVAPASGRQVLLLEWPGGDGELVVYPAETLSTGAERVLSDGLFGTQAILIDLMTVAGTPWPIALLSAIILIAVLREKRYEREFQLIWRSALAGGLMSGLAMLYCLALEFDLLWPMIIAVGCGAATVSLLVYTDRQSAVRLISAVIVFMLPMLLGLGLFYLIWGISNRAMLSFSWGFILIGVSYGLVLLVSVWTFQIVSLRGSAGKDILSMGN